MDALNELFVRLRRAATPPEIEALQEGIWLLWLRTGNPSQDKQLEAGMRALAADDYTQAIQDFSALIEAAPQYAEGWNKRATAYYMRGEYRAALQDIARTLRLEPCHFGALMGKAQILLMLEHWSGALASLERVARLCPNWPGLQGQIYDLRDKTDELEN
ncbi:tetratricopeptide repeat protein [Hymenobacter sp. J193]|uniref:tetratricopeptide repeat protein n=1 Tax=Hymenobacter sp. J193 TaxID=2898429 RepID=UPI002151C0A0|nr:tetratricopeptide repeat protein [Hymenobacter sp. J193]MCR5887425.1 tetratricopeptide repeat protein [Hymenobacter sp. J193]